MLSCYLQFLYLKNVRVFLQSCKKSFGIKDADLFDPYDLVEAKDFNKVCISLLLSSYILLVLSSKLAMLSDGTKALYCHLSSGFAG